MGDVHEAHDDRVLEGFVATNVLAPVFSRVRGFVERPRRGARAAVHLN
jgi:hypothetical protein